MRSGELMMKNPITNFAPYKNLNRHNELAGTIRDVLLPAPDRLQGAGHGAAQIERLPEAFRARSLERSGRRRAAFRRAEGPPARGDDGYSGPGPVLDVQVAGAAGLDHLRHRFQQGNVSGDARPLLRGTAQKHEGAPENPQPQSTGIQKPLRHSVHGGRDQVGRQSWTRQSA